MRGRSRCCGFCRGYARHWLLNKAVVAAAVPPLAVVAPRLTARQRAMAQAGRKGLLPAMQRCAPRALKFLQSPHPAGTLRRLLMARRSASEQKSSAAHRPVEAVRASPLPPVRLQGIVGRSRSYQSAAEVQFECEARRWPRSPWLSLLYMARALRTQAQRTEGRGARMFCMVSPRSKHSSYEYM